MFQNSNLYLIFNDEELAILANAQIRSNLTKLKDATNSFFKYSITGNYMEPLSVNLYIA